MSDSTSPACHSAGTTSVQDDRRASERYDLESGSACRLVRDGGDPGPRLTVRNLSATGIGLEVHQAIKPGSVLLLSLDARSRQMARPLPVRVLHATLVVDGTWYVGCQFIRKLSDAELRAFLPES